MAVVGEKVLLFFPALGREKPHQEDYFIGFSMYTVIHFKIYPNTACKGIKVFFFCLLNCGINDSKPPVVRNILGGKMQSSLCKL